MELLKENKFINIKDTYLLSISDFIILISCVLVTLIHDAFMFNPLIIAFLYLAYKRGLIVMIPTYLISLLVAFLINSSYGFELLIIESIYILLMLFTSYLLSNKIKYIVPILICIIESILILVYSFSFQLLFLCFLNTFISILIIISFEKFVLKIIDKYSSFSIVYSSIVIGVLSIIFMFNQSIGLVFARAFILINYKDRKSANNIISLLFSSILLYYFCNIDSLNLLFYVIPLLLTSFINGRYKIVFYLVTHILLSFTLDPIFYSNAIFYQGLSASLLNLLIPNKLLNNIIELFDDKNVIINQDISLENEVMRIIHYIDAVSLGMKNDNKKPLPKAYQRVLNRVCFKCTHRHECKVKNALNDLLSEKLTSTDRKWINQECIYPFKLVMEIQQAFEIYLANQTYYNDLTNQIKNVNNVLLNIKEPLLAFINHKKQFSNKNELILETSNSLNNNQINNVIFNNRFIQLNTKIRNNINLEELENIISIYTGGSYSFFRKTKDFLNNIECFSFVKKETSSFTYNVYTKALDNEYNGDSNYITQDEQLIKFLICDGMGHGKEANEISELLVKMFQSLLQTNISTNIVLEQINTILRASSNDDIYSTIDYLQINKETLKGSFIKMGCVSSLVFRNDEKILIKEGGLPIGLIDEYESEVHEFDFEHNDIIMLYSDGLSEYLNEFDYHKYLKISDINLMVRAIFADADKALLHKDDMTLIVIKIL